ncbi:MAG: hypothetical protein GX969_02620 [Firmicutes bacterium]|nr:hypothetical protein [Bacillota bacterium]
MKRLSVISLVLGLTLLFGSITIVYASPLNQGNIKVNVSNPLYAEIRGLESERVLPDLTFGDGAYQNKSIIEYFDIVTNGDVNFTTTLTGPFSHVDDDDFWLRCLVYVRDASGNSVYKTKGGHPRQLEFNWQKGTHENQLWTALLNGPSNYENMYMDIQASKYGADVHELMAGEYTTEILLTVSAP